MAAGANQIFTIVAFALIVVLVLGFGLLVAILVQRRRTKRANAAAAERRAARQRAADAGELGLEHATETSGGISLLGLSVREPTVDRDSAAAGERSAPWGAPDGASSGVRAASGPGGSSGSWDARDAVGAWPRAVAAGPMPDHARQATEADGQRQAKAGHAAPRQAQAQAQAQAPQGQSVQAQSWPTPVASPFPVMPSLPAGQPHPQPRFAVGEPEHTAQEAPEIPETAAPHAYGTRFSGFGRPPREQI